LTSEQKISDYVNEKESGDEFDTVQIEELGDIITGSTPSTKQKEFYGGDTPFIKVSDINSHYPFIQKTDKGLTKKGAEDVANRELPKNAVMVTCIGSIGKNAITTERCFTNQQINSIVPYEEFDHWYVYYKIETLSEKLKSYSGGSAQPILSKTNFSQIDIEIHSEKVVRNKIGELLSCFDKKIRVNRRIDKLLEEMAQSLFKSWFVELEHYDGEVEYDEDLERDIPVSWEKVSLDSIANFLNGKAWQDYSSENKEENNLPVVKIKELRNGITEDSDRVTKSRSPENYILDDGDVVFSWSASLVLDLWSEGEAFLNQHLFKVTSQEYPRWFFYLWIDHHIRLFRHIAEAKKTTMGHIKRSDLKEAKVSIPSEDELEKISEKMKPIFEKRVECKIENRKSEQLRDTLLPKLMSGEIRINGINLDDLEVDSEV
jgi:type I restriction enzyme S subunit